MIQEFVKNTDYKIKTKNGFEDFDGLVKTKAEKINIITIITETFKRVSCTEFHKFFDKDNSIIQAKDIVEGMEIWTKDGLERVISISKELKSNFEVIDVVNSESNSFYVNDINSHNCDEFAFVQKNIAEDFWNSNYPTISSSKESKVIIISTPNGGNNLFYRLYHEAERGINAFKHKKITWREVPGRDDEWANTQLKNMTAEQFAQEFNCEFILGNVNTLVNTLSLDKLSRMVQTNPFLIELQGRLRIYERPESGASYIIGVDPAKGTGLHDSAVQIMKIVKEDKKVSLEQVATFQDNRTQPYTLAEITSRLSIYYNNALIMCENNGEGSAVIQHLWWTFENPNLYNTGSKEKSLGIRATRTSKQKAVLDMKKMAENDQLIIRDNNTFTELTEFIEDENGQFHGREGFPDDLVSALYWACYAMELDIHDEDLNIYTNEEDEEDDVWGLLSDVNPRTEEYIF